MVVNHNSVMVLRIILFILLMKENLYVYSSGYDAYSSCYRKSRKRQELPCDFGKQTWCNIPGNSYPWHAVRRFVHENQGLMRRMYGDEKHLSVLRAELESNDIELFDAAEYKEDFRRRYSKDMDSSKGFLRMFMDGERRRSSESENRRRTKAEKMRKSIDEKSNNVLYHNHFKNQKEGEARTPPGNYLGNRTFTRSSTTSTTTTTVSEATLRAESITQLNDLLRMNMSTIGPNDTTPQFTSAAMDITTQSEAGQRDNFPTLSRPEDGDASEEEDDYSGETEAMTTTTTVGDTLTTTTDLDFEDEEAQMDRDEAYQDVTEVDEEEEEEEEEEEDTAAAGEQEAVKEPVSQQTPPMIRLKGINACPVKEEVVAPFWANNTRGEVLALLNLYPFEQYVHWEKCTFEHKQMFCREGCRCEQQYRLHRLLAYDPNNECRGIFSDWFRFPSCCVCKCYDIPMEFRLTSRSPRIEGTKFFKKGTLKGNVT